jgi:hypothetical protein
VVTIFGDFVQFGAKKWMPLGKECVSRALFKSKFKSIFSAKIFLK